MIKITKDSRLMIWGASKEVRSGGAEILNKLAAYLKSLGVNAKIFSWAMPVYEQPEYYKNLYDVNCGSWEEITDDENLIILIPEVMIENPDNVNFFCSFKKTQFIIWWLSSAFDYTDMTKKNSKRLQLRQMRSIENRCLHLYENEVCARDLLYHGITTRMRLQHGVHPLFYSYPKQSKKKNKVIFNGGKAINETFVNKIKEKLPEIEFIEIGGNINNYKGKEDLISMYDEAKVYIDFNGFEGREMCPREAVLRDCVLLLGNAGNAETFDDYPLPSWYKVEYFTDEAINEVCDKILECMNNYEEHLQDMNLFKRKCLLEPREWENMVYLIFSDMIPDENKIIKE